MTTTLSSKGQIVLPSVARKRMGLTPGVRFTCQVKNGTLILTPVGREKARSRLTKDKSTGLVVTQGPAGAPLVTNEQVRALLADFP